MAKKPEYNYKSLQTEYGKMPPQAVDLEVSILIMRNYIVGNYNSSG